MADLVNDYFRRFYPDPLDQDKFEFDGAGGGMWTYTERNGRHIFPNMVCADGFSMSVQGHYGAYSQPRDDFAERYSQVEVGYPNAREDLLTPYLDNDGEKDPTQQRFAWVPVEVVEAVVEKHGGLVPQDEDHG